MQINLADGLKKVIFECSQMLLISWDTKCLSHTQKQESFLEYQIHFAV